MLSALCQVILAGISGPACLLATWLAFVNPVVLGSAFAGIHLTTCTTHAIFLLLIGPTQTSSCLVDGRCAFQFSFSRVTCAHKHEHESTVNSILLYFLCHRSACACNITLPTSMCSQHHAHIDSRNMACSVSVFFLCVTGAQPTLNLQTSWAWQAGVPAWRSSNLNLPA
jgi:hypothetical protein